MSDFVNMLVEMGFDREKAIKAVDATSGSGVEPAMEWILSQPQSNEVVPNVEDGTSEQSDTSKSTVDTVVRSYKCEDCGRQFKNDTEMEFHAAKTGHTNFSESNEEKKPLTEEEKAAQLKRIEEKLKEKRIEREAREKVEALEKEKLRMKSGKDLTEAKRRIEEQQMKEIVEARRRDKMEEKVARDRVRAQIEADKAARKAKQEGAQGIVAVSPVASPTSVSVEPATPGVKKDYKETKLQLRLPNGKALVQSFGAQEPLAAVRLYVEINRDDGLTGPFNLMSTFPRKVYENEDYSMPLEALGLVPSAVLMVTKSMYGC